LSPQDPRGLTVTGGLPYFGGPGNSYSTHAIASMVEKLRERKEAFGLVGANGGHMSKYAVGIYSTRPAQFNRCDSSPLQSQVDSWPAPTVAGEADGPATIESYTVVHGKSGPSNAVVVGRLDGTGERFLANTHDEDDRTLHSMIEDDPLGAAIHVRSFEYGNRFVFAKPSR
jgi:acetyl-CoA C-acetyltransferase